MAKLTAKQKRFCDEYLIDLNATQAAIRAGYSKKTARAIANENLTKPAIKEYINQRMEEKEKELIPDVNGTMRKQTVKEEVPQIIEIPARLSDSNKAAELLGKAYGIYTDKVEADVDMELNINIDYGDGNEN